MRDNYFIVKCLLKSNAARVILLTYWLLAKYKRVEAKTASANLTWLYFYLHISVPIFFTLSICFIFNGLFWIFKSLQLLHSIIFGNTYLLSCLLQCIDIFSIKFRVCKTCTVINSVTRILLIKTLSKFRVIKFWITLYLHMHVLG